MRFALAIITVVLLSGCAHKFTRESVELAITKGKTTKNEVLKSFGQPDRIWKTSGIKMSSGDDEYVIHSSREVWSYSNRTLKLLDVLEPDMMKIVFDESGIVVYYDFRGDGR